MLNAFFNGRVYDFYIELYDVSGNEYIRVQNDFVDNRTYDDTAPTVVINGEGTIGGSFGPGNNPITNNPTDDNSAPHYHTDDEDITIYFNWQPETMYGFNKSDVQVNGTPWTARHSP